MSQIQTFYLPDIGEGISEVEIINWLKEEGDRVEENEAVVTVLTDKVSVELPAPCCGILIKKYYQSNQIACVNQPLFDVECDVDDEPNIKSVLALPSTRQLAKTQHVDIHLIKGTGSQGRVTDEDVHEYVRKQKCQGEADGVALCPIKRQMIKTMTESNDIPHFSYFEQVDATHLIELRHDLVLKGNQGLTFMPFFIKALSLTIDKYRILNSSLNEHGKLVFHQEHHLSIAVKTEKGLVVPVLKNIQHLEFEKLLTEYQSLIHRAKNHCLEPSDMKGGRVTLSNFGTLGNGLWTTPRITSGQVAVLALAKIQKQPFVKDGCVVPLDVLNLSWSFDHRVIDGEEAAAISTHFATLIQNPDLLMEDVVRK